MAERILKAFKIAAETLERSCKKKKKDLGKKHMPIPGERAPQ